MNKDSTINQDIFLHNRKELSISSVKKMNCLNDLLFDIETGYGRIKIEGKELDMVSLDNDKGILILKGVIDKIEYIEEGISLLSSLEKNISDCKADLDILNNESIDTLKAKKGNMQKMLDEIVNEINLISKKIDSMTEQYMKEVFYEWTLDVRDIPTECTSVVIGRKSTFWGNDKNINANIDLPNINKLIQNLSF